MATQRFHLFTAVTAVNLSIITLVLAIGAVAQAADRTHRASSQDLAAGRWMDSLLDPDAIAKPMLPKQRMRSQGPNAASRSLQRGSNLRGKLVKNPNNEDGSPAFALVDQHGGVLRYVEPVKSVDLNKYLGKTIGVRRDTGDILLASQLALPRNSRGAAPNNVRLAQNLEPIPAGEPVTPGEVVGESTPISGPDQGPIYLDNEQPGGYHQGGYVDDGLNFGGCPTCGDVTCGGCVRGGPCGFGARGLFYVHGEYLIWAVEGMDIPPLVTQVPYDTNTFTPTGPATTLLGNQRVLEDGRSGGRLTFGYWLDDYGQWGLEGQYLSLGRMSDTFSAGVKDGDFPQDGLFIFRPFFNTGIVDSNNNGLDAPDLDTRGRSLEDVDTDQLDGRVTVGIASEFQSAGLLVRHSMCCRPGCCEPCCGDGVGCGSGCGTGCGAGVGAETGLFRRLGKLLHRGTRRTDLLMGIRWTSLTEALVITEDLQEIVSIGTDPDQTVTLGQEIDVADFFGADNDFFGGEIGYETEWEHRRWSLSLLTKVAIGSTRQRVAIQGATVLDDGIVPIVSNNGGLLTQNYAHPGGFNVGNIGIFERDEFSMIPEVGLTLGYNVTPRLKVTGGYSLLYWSNVVRPGDQIDLDVNANLLRRDGIPDPDTIVRDDHPRFDFRQTDLWVQGLNFGAEYTW